MFEVKKNRFLESAHAQEFFSHNIKPWFQYVAILALTVMIDYCPKDAQAFLQNPAQIIIISENFFRKHQVLPSHIFPTNELYQKHLGATVRLTYKLTPPIFHSQ